MIKKKTNVPGGTGVLGKGSGGWGKGNHVAMQRVKAKRVEKPQKDASKSGYSPLESENVDALGRGGLESGGDKSVLFQLKARAGKLRGGRHLEETVPFVPTWKKRKKKLENLRSLGKKRRSAKRIEKPESKRRPTTLFSAGPGYTGLEKRPALGFDLL